MTDAHNIPSAPLDLGFCGCLWQSAIDRGRGSRTQIHGLCRAHFWAARESQRCPDCGGLCGIAEWWKGDRLA